MKWSNKTKEKISVFSALFLLLFGCVLLAWGFATPPPGEIHSSIQFIFGEILFFSGGVFGLDLYITHRVKKIRDEERGTEE